MMSAGPAANDTIPPAALRDHLRRLARLLLPAEALDARPPSSGEPFLVTTDGFLGAVPFETFDVGTGAEYIPLLMSRDVAYLHFAGEPVEGAEHGVGITFGASGTDRDIDGAAALSGIDGRDAAPGVILVNAAPSRSLLKRYPFQPALEEVMAEGMAVSSAHPEAVLLAGEAASKSNLVSIWERVSFIYIAAHMLRDPQVPYLMLIPLASLGDGEAPDEAYLDIADIRAADFDGCRTVVLSGCSSGAPYLEARISGPSLGDAFLDAGAAAVIHTFWDVPDRGARRLMTAYLEGGESTGIPGIRALCDVRRTAFRSSEHARHPFGWAAYSIKIGRL